MKMAARDAPTLLVQGLALCLTLSAPAVAADLVVWAPPSFKLALDAANPVYTQMTGTRILVTYSGSSGQVQQIEAGAHADLLIAAALEWMNRLQDRNLIKPDTRAPLVRDSLALLAAPSETRTIAIVPGFPLADLLGSGKLAVADPAVTTSGMFGRLALQRLGLWDSIESKLMVVRSGGAVRGVVGSGAAQFGIVLASDAAAHPDLRTVATFPSASHPPIVYPMAVLSISTNIEAPHYATWLRSWEALPFFANQGYAMVTSGGRQ
jgi:molybdate transport system substrate-binding protein